MCAVYADGILNLADKTLWGPEQAGCIGGIWLEFNPLKLILLIVWVYLCMYSVKRIENSPLVPREYTPIANVFSLFFGPFILFVLFVADRAGKVQEGKISISDIWGDFFSDRFRRSGGSEAEVENPIELIDSSGRSFFEVYNEHAEHDISRKKTLDLTENIILDAIDQRASDILIDPKGEEHYEIRFRVDGFLKTIYKFKSSKCAAVINSIKAISGMDITEKRRPQDGAFMARIPEGKICFRAASAGVLGGEKLSIRVLNPRTGLLKLDDIGLTKKQRLILEDLINKPSGMVLMCGPTGSGKTTTMYAMLGEIDTYTHNVITVEDPIEYVLPNASQIEINTRAGITFAKSLQSILRQGPDVICIGEIRDEETANIALEASQTGHLVLATIHSNSNASSLIRLLDLGVSPMLISTGLNALISQRLLRRLCDNCKVRSRLSQNDIEDFRKRNINHTNIFKPAGCKQCDGTGYYGRIAIYDILVLDKALKTSIANNTLPIEQLRKEGDKRGKSNLQKQGLKLVVSGITSIDELKQVVG